jgi:DNA-binding MurR/RpiR family transcriptional regulator
MTDEADKGPPRNFKDLRDLLLGERPKLPKRLQQVADFAATNPDDIAFGTAASIAEAVGVQPSTLVRFSQSLGYRGFSELQEVFRERLRDRPSSYDARLDALREAAGTNATSALLAGFCGAAVRSLERLKERTAPATLEEAAARLASAETIYLIGQRRSFPVTTYMSYAFGQLGIKTVLIGSAAGTDPETLRFATPRDAAIAVSFAPYAPATLAHVRQIAAQGTPVIAVTDSPFSPLVTTSSLWFEVAEADYEGFRSLSATFALVMTLMVAIADARRQIKK